MPRMHYNTTEIECCTYHTGRSILILHGKINCLHPNIILVDFSSPPNSPPHNFIHIPIPNHIPRYHHTSVRRCDRMPLFEATKTSCARGDTICPRPARCTHAAAHLQLQSIAYTPYACGAPCSMNIHDRQAAARSGWWRRDLSRRYTLTCSDLNSQPKRPGDLDF